MLARRWRVSLVLTALLFVLYYGYIVLIATDRELFCRRRIGEVTTVGIPARRGRHRRRLGADGAPTWSGPTGTTIPKSSGCAGGCGRLTRRSCRRTLGTPTVSAVLFFLVIVALTLVVTYWAARRTKSTREFYAAGRSISPLQNGLALAGDYMSAASFLGIAGLVALRGYDGMIYATGWLVGWPALMFLIAEPLRNLGKFTFADVVAFRLRQVPVRIASAVGGILTLLFYVLAQMVGAGNLISLMFGLSYEWAVVSVGAVMLMYVLFGGMIATTWVQIIKAILLLFGVTLLTLLVLAQFGFSPGALYAAVAAQYGQAALEPGGLVTDPIDAISLGLALMLGLLGLPHILMRFYTVPDARAARSSVLYATGFIGYFYLIIPIVGFGASALVGPRSDPLDSTLAATWRRRSSRRCSAARRSSGSSPPSRSPRSSRSWLG